MKLVMGINCCGNIEFIILQIMCEKNAKEMR